MKFQLGCFYNYPILSYIIKSVQVHAIMFCVRIKLYILLIVILSGIFIKNIVKMKLGIVFSLLFLPVWLLDDVMLVFRWFPVWFLDAVFPCDNKASSYCWFKFLIDHENEKHI